MTILALVGADVHDGVRLHHESAVLVRDGRVSEVIPVVAIPDHIEQRTIPDGIIVPGFVDLQSNGGGGVMFNSNPCVESLVVMSKAHARSGTSAFLPTFITDTPQKTQEAIDAVKQAIDAHIPGVFGLHLEGPHLSLVRKGAHDPQYIRPMTPQDMALLINAAEILPNVMVTLAPESVEMAQIEALSRVGIIVSLGHSDASYARAIQAFDHGARCVTHLFNAMSQFGHREPGLVGAALDDARVCVGMICDSVHVHCAAMRIAMRAKAGSGNIFLVTDSMATLGSDITEFTINERRVVRRDGRLTLSDGTLAGADLSFADAVRVAVDEVSVDMAHAIAMCTSIPAKILNNSYGAGSIKNAELKNLCLLDKSFILQKIISNHG